MRRSRALSAVALVAGAALALSACGGGGGGGQNEQAGLAACDQNPVTCNSATSLQQGGQLSYTIEKNIDNWNPLSADGNVFDLTEPAAGYLPRAWFTDPAFNVQLNKDLMVSADQTSTSPQTLVYKIQPNAAWDDGSPINADDFIYNWKIQNGKDCPDCTAASTSGFDQIQSVVGSDNGKTVTVTMTKPFTDWQSLWGSGAPLLPAHIAAQHGDTTTPAGLAQSFDFFAKNMPTFSGGPYKISNFQDNVALTEVPNPKWYGQAKPHLDRIIWRIITDATQEAPALANNEVQVIYPQPQVDLVSQVKNIPNTTYTIGLGLQWEHFDFNFKNPFLADKTLRQAMFTAVDRQAIINKTVGQFTNKVKPLDSVVYVPQQPGYQDTLSQTGQGNGDLNKAMQMLTSAGYKIGNGQLTAPNGQAVPPLRIRYTTGNAIRQNECELFAAQMKPLGLNVQVVPTDSLGKTTTSGDFDLIVFAWVDSPFPFAGAQQIYESNSASNYGHYSNPQVDQMLNEAASQTDVTQARQILNDAAKIISTDSYELPLYQKPTFIAAYNNVGNVRNNSSLDGPPYNVVDWGVRAGG